MNTSKELLFNQLIKDHKGIVFAVLKKYDILEEHPYAGDYIQHIYAQMWHRFQSFVYKDDQSFSAWMWQSAEWSILNFYQKCKRWNKEKPIDMVFVDDCGDDEYDEAHIQGLYRAIAAMDNPDREIFMLYANGEEIAEIAGKVNLTKSAISHRLQRGYACIRAHAHIYFEIVPKCRKAPHLTRRGGANRLSKPIAQYDLQGNLIQVFPSAGEAERAGYKSKRVSDVATGKKNSWKGFVWKFVETAAA